MKELMNISAGIAISALLCLTTNGQPPPTDSLRRGDFEVGPIVIDGKGMISPCTLGDTLCCDRVLYNPLDTHYLRRYMVNYRDHVWSKTSPYFESHPYKDHWNELCKDVTPAGALDTNDRFDARYLDVSIEQLENYLCRIKNMPVCKGQKNADMVRIYYLRYDSLEQDTEGRVPKNFHKSHTLAFTPLLSTDVWSSACMGQLPMWIPEPGKEPSIANHNQICPPLICDHLESMIKYVDCEPGFKP